MASTRVDYTTMDWTSGVPFYGPGGIAWLVKMTPPPGKLTKIVALALSDEHIFSLQGGRSTKSGDRAQGR